MLRYGDVDSVQINPCWVHNIEAAETDVLADLEKMNVRFFAVHALVSAVFGGQLTNELSRLS